MYHSFLIHSSADGHLGCFHALAIINSAVINIGVHVSLSDLVSSVCMQGHVLKFESTGHLLQALCKLKITQGPFSRENWWLAPYCCPFLPKRNIHMSMSIVPRIQLLYPVLKLWISFIPIINLLIAKNLQRVWFMVSRVHLQAFLVLWDGSPLDQGFKCF